MTLSVAALQARRALLQRELAEFEANLYRLQGAIALADELIAKEEAETHGTEADHQGDASSEVEAGGAAARDAKANGSGRRVPAREAAGDP